MNPSTGTFITMDEYAGTIFEPVSLHKYLYAAANPITYCDPSGYDYSLAETEASSVGHANLAVGNAIVSTAARVRCMAILSSLLAISTRVLVDKLEQAWLEICVDICNGTATSSTVIAKTFDTVIDDALPKIKTKEKDMRQKPPRQGWIAYGDLDELGRATGAQALITKDMIKTGSVASIVVAGIEKYYDRGHLIASNLGGSGSEPRNLTPVHQHFNRGQMRNVEKRVAFFASSGIDTYMEVTPYYDGDELIPDCIIMYISNAYVDEMYIIGNDYHY